MLTGDSSGFAGTTRVANGATLQLGDGGTSGALGGNVAVNGTLASRRSDSAILSATLTGAGTFDVSGGAVLTGDASGFTGTTRVANGATLQIGNGGGAGALGGSVVDRGTLAFNRNDTSTLPVTLSGAGASTSSAGRRC